MYREIIDSKILEFTKSRNEVSLSVWKDIKNEFLKFKTGKDTAGKELTDEVEFKLISKLAAQRRDSEAQFATGGRADLALKEHAELEVLESLLPKEPTEAELKASVKAAVEELIAMNGQVSMRDMKAVYSMVRQKYPTASGGVVANLFKVIL